MKVEKAIIKAYYNLGEEFILFPDNPLHGKTYENVKVTFKKEILTMCGISYGTDVIKIGSEEPIECQLLGKHVNPEGTLVIKICQDWG